MRNLNFGDHFLANLSIDLGGMEYATTPCSFVEAHAKFILGKLYSREKTLLT